MIVIKKNREPYELIRYRHLSGATYEDMHGAPTGRKHADGSNETVYEVVLNNLMKEQGYLCAYCMRRIPEKKGHPRATIEHIDPQSRFSSKALDYRNMLAVCSGNRNAQADDDKICDARRKDRKLDLNPLRPETIAGIQYKRDGTIFSEDETINNQLNDVLNLNCRSLQLADCRKSALQTLIHKIQEKHPAGDIRDFCRRQLEIYRGQEPYKTPYVGILMDWLEKHK